MCFQQFYLLLVCITRQQVIISIYLRIVFTPYQLIRMSSVMKQYPAEAAELFAAAQKNAQWRYKSYLRMLQTDWSDANCQ